MTNPHTATIAELYTFRSSQYDNFWHPSFALHILETALAVTRDGLPESPVHLDLACGTGLVTIPAVQRLPPNARIYGIDISPGMLGEARKKLSSLLADQQVRVSFREHDMTHLREIPALAGLQGKVDIITCASAFVLLPSAEKRMQALREWAWMLKPGSGRLIFDVTHEHNLRSGIVMEHVAERLGLKAPSDRKWIYDKDAVYALLNKVGGFDIERVEQKEETGEGVKKWLPTREVAVERFDVFVNNKAYEAFRAAGEDLMAKAKQLFVQLWAEARGEDGMVDDVDGVYVVVARKKDDA